MSKHFIICGILFLVFAAGDYSILAIDSVFNFLTTTPNTDTTNSSVGKVVYSVSGLIMVLFSVIFTFFFAFKKEKAAFQKAGILAISSFSGLIFAALVIGKI